MARKTTQTLPHLTEDVARLVDDLARETDRGCALLAAAFVDDVLDVMLRAAFVDVPDAVNKILGTGRPLESFGARSHLAYCIGLLGNDVYADINLIREIRNDFAHRQPTSFLAKEIDAKCRRLQCVATIMPDEGISPRDRFVATVMMIANHLLILSEQQSHAVPTKDFAENGILRVK
ncbi:MAG: MltR family transcriptional regulator [Tepidisphaeraceae bacterium]|jgi:DNA-binding MltR family transcriptional regulator